MLKILLSHFDWIGVVCGLIGWWVITNNKTLAAKIMIIGASSWIIWGIISQTWSVVLAQTYFLIMYIRLLLKERKRKQE
jgi:hypothetical protein